MSQQLDQTHRLELDRDTMRTLGYQVIDMIIDHLEKLPQKSATGFASRDELENILRESPPRQGCDFSEVLALLDSQVFSKAMWSTHPRHFAWVPGPSNFVVGLEDETRADRVANEHDPAPAGPVVARVWDAVAPV